ncbi:MAG: DUF2064 domain-containing protein [Chthoniobacterales bacterium]
MFPTSMSRRALLIFADDARLDLARRRLPLAALPLLLQPDFDRAPVAGVDVHVFRSRTARGRSERFVHAQSGRNFAERFENAVETLAALGYQEIVAVGRDCPELSTSDIANAFDHLGQHSLVLGPDHRGGCYLIAFRAAARTLLRGIRWKRNTDCAQLRARAGEARVFMLAVKHDIDSWADVRLAARASTRLAALATFLLRTVAEISSELALFVHASTRFIRLHGQMPPPCAAL